MNLRHPTKRISFGAVLAAMAFIGISFAPPLGGTTPAAAQQVSVEFRAVLQPHGQWRRSSRWGEVWIPARVDRDWRPYTVGRWVYTDDWGWYWVTDKPEAAWGWVVYHYGRWVLDAELGWVWVPGREWGPAWVTWRRGHDHIGWAPLPPEPVVVEYRETPDVWIFVRARDFTAPDVARVAIPRPRIDTYIRETVIVNRTVVVRDRGPRVVVVNPGIEPRVVSAVVGQPLRTYRVRPHVLAGTSRVANAVEVRASDARQVQRAATSVSVQQTETTIEPAKDVPEPQPLAAESSGRLGENPPKAAQSAAQQEEEQKQGDTTQSKPDQEQGQAAQQQRDVKQGEQAGQAAQQESDQTEKQQSQADEKKPDQKQEAQGKQEAQETQEGQAADRERTKPERSAGQERKQEQEKEKGKSARTDSKKPQDRPAQRAQEKAQDQDAAQQRRNIQRQGEVARKKAEERAGEAAQKQGAERPSPSATTGQEPGRAQGSPRAGDVPQARQSLKDAAPQRGGGSGAADQAPAAKPQRSPETEGRGPSAGRRDGGGAGAADRGPAAKPPGLPQMEGRGGPAGRPGSGPDEKRD